MTAWTETAATAGISDQQLAALVDGGWRDEDASTPGWEREQTGG